MDTRRPFVEQARIKTQQPELFGKSIKCLHTSVQNCWHKHRVDAWRRRK